MDAVPRVRLPEFFRPSRTIPLLITPLTEPGQALQPAPIRTVLPRFARLPAPLRSAGFPSHTLGAVLPVPGLIGA